MTKTGGGGMLDQHVVSFYMKMNRFKIHFHTFFSLIQIINTKYILFETTHSENF